MVANIGIIYYYWNEHPASQITEYLVNYPDLGPDDNLLNIMFSLFETQNDDVDGDISIVVISHC